MNATSSIEMATSSPDMFAVPPTQNPTSNASMQNVSGPSDPLSAASKPLTTTTSNPAFIPPSASRHPIVDPSAPIIPFGSAVSNAAAANKNASLNPRSCVTCRKRKVKCDKKHPCAHCQRAGIECIFPHPGRAPRRPRKPQDAELLARLRRLEGVVRKLGHSETESVDDLTPVKPSQSADKTSRTNSWDPAPASTSLNSPGATITASPPGVESSIADMTNSLESWSSKPSTSSDSATVSQTHPDGLAAQSVAKPVENRQKNGTEWDRLEERFEDRFRRYNSFKLEKEMGHLVVGDGKSRYVNSTFWANLTEEIAEMRDLLRPVSDEEESPDEDEDDEDATPDSMRDSTPGSGRGSSKPSHQEFIFGYSASMTNLRVLHPLTAHVPLFWERYKIHVDPMVRILHKPSIDQLMIQAARDPTSLTRPQEALVFAIYYSALTALSAEDSQELLQLDRDIGLRRFRFATEQAMARAHFLSCQDMQVLQAFLLYMIMIRRNEDSKPVWSLMGLFQRVAHSMGLHRDGENFGLPPFETEMRRRLFWQVVMIDVRVSEDVGCDPMIVDRFFDTRVPLNINDTDFWPDMKETPQERVGGTEMTFDLVRYEIGRTARAIHALNKCTEGKNQTASDLVGPQERLLERLRLRLEEKYLRHCDLSKPLEWVAAIASRLVLSKFWLIIYHPWKARQPGQPLEQAPRERIFRHSIDTIRYSRLLETTPGVQQWSWHYTSHMQWHALAFLLAELSLHNEGTDVTEAWNVVSDAWVAWYQRMSERRSPMWRPLRRLYARARALRIKDLEKERAATGASALSAPLPPPDPPVPTAKPSPRHSGAAQRSSVSYGSPAGASGTGSNTATAGGNRSTSTTPDYNSALFGAASTPASAGASASLSPQNSFDLGQDFDLSQFLADTDGTAIDLSAFDAPPPSSTNFVPSMSATNPMTSPSNAGAGGLGMMDANGGTNMNWDMGMDTVMGGDLNWDNWTNAMQADASGLVGQAGITTANGAEAAPRMPAAQALSKGGTGGPNAQPSNPLSVTGLWG